MNPYLFDNTGIDEDTIYLILGEFSLYYVYTEDFDFYFKQELRKHYPIYLKILNIETKEVINNLSTNIRFTQFADEVIDSSFTKQKGKTTNESESKTNSSSENYSNDKSAHKETPMTTIGDGTLGGLFDWDDASNIDESNTNGGSSDNSTTNETATAKQLSKLMSIAKKFNTYNTNSKELNQQAVLSIENIVSYYFKQNKSFDYLIKKLKPCFVNVY